MKIKNIYAEDIFNAQTIPTLLCTITVANKWMDTIG